jgi:hypothetical protein
VRLLAIAILIGFNAAMMTLWFVAGPSRDELVVGGWIPGDAMLLLIAAWAIEHWPGEHT